MPELKIHTMRPPSSTGVSGQHLAKTVRAKAPGSGNGDVVLVVSGLVAAPFRGHRLA
jgi:hypothetical protein